MTSFVTRSEAVLLRIGGAKLTPELLDTITDLRVAGVHVGILGMGPGHDGRPGLVDRDDVEPSGSTPDERRG